jgi:hypothetical protein
MTTDIIRYSLGEQVIYKGTIAVVIAVCYKYESYILGYRDVPSNPYSTLEMGKQTLHSFPGWEKFVYNFLSYRFYANIKYSSISGSFNDK